MRFQLNGQFRVFDAADRDITPTGIKERGLLALLVLSPGQRRTRIWIQDKLWSDRSAEQASGSCRQALSNIRKAFGPETLHLHSDRSAVWIDPQIAVQQTVDPDRGELLEDIDISDPEFTDWLRDIRGRQEQVSPPSRILQTHSLQPTRRPLVAIRHTDLSGTSRGLSILHSLSQRLAARLVQLGGIDVTELGAQDKQPSDDEPNVWVNLECLDDRDLAYVLLRVLGQPNKRVLWSGRLSLERRLAVIWVSPDVTRAINQIVRAVGDAVVGTHGKTPMAIIQKAIRRRYEFKSASLQQADDLLRSAMDSDLRGLALAWRGLIRHDEVVEFCGRDTDRLAEAVDFVDQATRLATGSSTVMAMASEVTFFLEDDLDKAVFLANRAVQLDDQDPEALSALGRTLSLQGRNDASHHYAVAARHYADGSPYSYDWDLMLCVAKIRVGDMAGAYDMALICHRKMPFARHALRYLTVLSFLDDRPADAMLYSNRLRRLEPDFSIQTLLNSYAPLSNIRDVELMGKLRQKLL